MKKSKKFKRIAILTSSFLIAFGAVVPTFATNESNEFFYPKYEFLENQSYKISSSSYEYLHAPYLDTILLKDGILLIDIYMKEVPSTLSFSAAEVKSIRYIHTYLENGNRNFTLSFSYEDLTNGLTVSNLGSNGADVIFEYVPTEKIGFEILDIYNLEIYSFYSDISPNFGFPVTNYQTRNGRRRSNNPIVDTSRTLASAIGNRGTTLTISQTVTNQNNWSVNVGVSGSLTNSQVSSTVGFNFGAASSISFVATNSWNVPYNRGIMRVHPTYIVYDFDIYRNTGSGFRRYGTGQARRAYGIRFAVAPF